MQRIIILLFLITVANAKSQNYLGLYTSNFAGVSGMQFNPANSSHNYLRYDVNLLSAGAAIHNEYLYVVGATVGSTIPKKKRAAYVDLQGGVDSGFLIYDFYDNLSGFDNIANVKVGGPGFMVKKNHFGFGLFTNMVGNFSALNVDKIINYDTLTNLNHYQVYDINKLELNTAAYVEIGANFSYNFLIAPDNQLSIGVNVKTLLGLEAAYIKNLRATKFYKNDDSSWVKGGDMEFGYATGLSETGYKYTPQVNGLGFAFDIGAEYIKNDMDGEILFKLGGVIKDVGFINFTNNSAAHRITTDNTVDWFNKAYRGITSSQSAAKIISVQSIGDSTSSFVKDNISMQTPASFNLYGEYAINKKYKIHFMFQRRINVFAHQVQSFNSIAITPRYETRWIEVGAPISLVEDKWFGVGLYARFGFITIGSDHINTWIFPQSRLSGSDIYFSLRFNPWNEKQKSRKGKSKDYGCFYKP